MSLILFPRGRIILAFLLHYWQQEEGGFSQWQNCILGAENIGSEKKRHSYLLCPTFYPHWQHLGLKESRAGTLATTWQQLPGPPPPAPLSQFSSWKHLRASWVKQQRLKRSSASPVLTQQAVRCCMLCRTEERFLRWPLKLTYSWRVFKYFLILCKAIQTCRKVEPPTYYSI